MNIYKSQFGQVSKLKYTAFWFVILLVIVYPVVLIGNAILISRDPDQPRFHLVFEYQARGIKCRDRAAVVSNARRVFCARERVATSMRIER